MPFYRDHVYPQIVRVFGDPPPIREVRHRDVRQTRYAPLVRPVRADDGGWTVDAWAPLEGRTINGGVRLRF